MTYYVMQNKVEANHRTMETYASKWEPTRRRGPAAICPDCGAPLSMLRWLPPFEVEIEMWGKDFGDIAWCPGDEFLISRRLLDLYLALGLTGLEGLEPVKVVRVVRKTKSRAVCPEYFRALPVRSRATVDDAASGVLLPPGSSRCHQCGEPNPLFARRIIFRADAMPTEDVFFARGMNKYLASERFTDMFEANNLTNALFVPAEEYMYDPYYLKSKPKTYSDDE